ncbi:MAG: CHASE2 domain-containing protein [Chitinophagaceae bacterium]
MVNKIIFSILCGFAVLLVTWIYQNYDFSFSVEDAFLKKVFLWKDKIYSAPSKQKADVLFINTGKDLALVEDTLEYGNVAVSDRQKIYQLLHYIDSFQAKPIFTVADIQFYYPYTINPQIDSSLSEEFKKNKQSLIPLMKNINGNYQKPLYAANYAYSDYRTYGSVFNKFRILNQSNSPSIPIAMDAIINHAVYEDHFFYSTSNGRLCLSAIWPSYYIKNDDVIKTAKEVTPNLQLGRESPAKSFAKNINIQYYNLGELTMSIETNPSAYTDFFNNQLVVIGNFDNDTHLTPVGRMAGPVLLTDIYLSLLNEQHIISNWFFIALLLVFSAISYVALFKKIPELKLNFKFLFSSYVVKFIKGYISYFGCMFVLSILVLIIFNVQVALFLPSFIFTWIEYIAQKKYKSTDTTK